jgi:hypothetical protein
VIGAWDYPDTLINFSNPALAGDFYKIEANSTGDRLSRGGGRDVQTGKKAVSLLRQLF